MTIELNWQTKSFSELSTDELYDLLKLRIDVFVVEQTCYYPDLDDIDRMPNVYHHFAYEKGEMVGYCRLIGPDIVYPKESAIGRVVVHQNHRGKSLGVTLMKSALSEVKQRWPQCTCHISAQQHLQAFYQNLGFVQITEMYLEDDIPHIGMRLTY
ncbi:GNAT family N-acetyltransferase [Psychrosphaera sp. B3R10]|uniref:GNAT family N-acetyltransferase n=1 Tax=Psychrosphaera algicola TaxID=3023714 RepID=A0ABT5FFC8_9GAMM|nr:MULTISPECIES: GNAT family N-acetyltransferase [unclassified Psychrosphaera]MBU2883407.1 GNAT family N-acetyltransferase [Psychrosphaera sp. I2R16]MBU2990499.1 GNAT family N-acetyltransferase [Psychrosphaera sp. B3R10]MDC2889759.1 GNAT family N-acetyltransferase [Psychrosphaera sp. G1-22]MDO6719027.1 GNAT family N-acetyltransferase [Psychrosphaera sp. 1_MG-2023]